MISVFGDAITVGGSYLGAAYVVPPEAKGIVLALNLSGWLSATNFYLEAYFSDDDTTYYALAGSEPSSIALVANTAITVSPYPFRFYFTPTTHPDTMFPFLITIPNPGLQFIKLYGQSATDSTDVLDIRMGFGKSYMVDIE